QAGEVRAMQPLAIDRRRRDSAHDDSLGAADDRPEEGLTLGLAALLRVVQAGERADAMVAQPRVVEQDSRDEERPRQRPATSLVGARDEAHAELAVELEELSPGASRHGARIAPNPAGARKSHAFVTRVPVRLRARPQALRPRPPAPRPVPRPSRARRPSPARLRPPAACRSPSAPAFP